MTDIKRILVPVDFSDCSSAALDTAAILALGFGATIDLLHVWDAPSVLAPETVVGKPDSFLTLAEIADAHSRTSMEKFAEAARGRGIPIQSTHRIQGAAAERICRFAKDEGYDLIAMGTHGRSGFTHLLMGSVAERVLRHSPVPVLTVRTRTLRVA